MKNKFKTILINTLFILLALYILMILAVYLDNLFRGGGVTPDVKMLLFFIYGSTLKAKIIFFLEVFVAVIYLLTNDVFLGSIKNEAKTFTVAGDIVLPVASGNNEHGSARFLTKDEIDNNFESVVLDKNYLDDLIKEGLKDKRHIENDETREINEIKNIVEIGEGGIVVNYEKTGKKEKIHFIGSNKNLIGIGQTRSGKARNFLLESIAMQALAGESIILNDPKGELYAYTVNLLKRLAYKVYTIDFREQKRSNRYNPLEEIIKYVDEDNLDEAINATWDLTSQLVGEAKGEKIWTNGEASVIASSIMCVVYDNRKTKKYRDLTNVYYFLFKMQEKVNKTETKLDKYIKTLPDTHPAVGLLGISKVAPYKTAGSFYTQALTTLRLFISPNIYNMTRESDFKIKDIADEKTAIFFIMPDEKDTYYPITSLMITQIYQSLVASAYEEGGVLSRRWNFDLDEFGNFVKIPMMTNMVSASLSRLIRLNLFLQSYSQLDKVYGKEDASTIKDNCEIKIFLQSGDSETKKQILADLDTYTIAKSTSSLSKNSSNNSLGSSSSENTTARELLKISELGRIKRPYHLVLSNTHPLIGYSPDLSAWYFNDIYGLGDIDFNKKVLKRRLEDRKEITNAKIKLWDVWNKEILKEGEIEDASTKNIKSRKTRL